jgi:predicted Zn-dependent protease
MPRRAARIDANQIEIVQTLRGAGATVQSLAAHGQGVPDILVGFRGLNFLMEIKNSAKRPSMRRLTVDEATWHQGWQGQIAVVLTPLDALRVIGAVE